jgi:hypothetical protein
VKAQEESEDQPSEQNRQSMLEFNGRFDDVTSSEGGKRRTLSFSTQKPSLSSLPDPQTHFFFRASREKPF